METIRALEEAGDEALALTSKAMSIRVSYQRYELGSDNRKDMFDRAVKQRNEVSSKLSEEGILEDERKQLQDRKMRLQGVVDKALEMVLADERAKAELMLDMQLLAVDQSRDFHRALWRAIGSIRNDLGLSVDQQELSEIGEASYERSRSALMAIADQLREQFNEHFDVATRGTRAANRES
jgi:hypothetical protein